MFSTLRLDMCLPRTATFISAEANKHVCLKHSRHSAALCTIIKVTSAFDGLGNFSGGDALPRSCLREGPLILFPNVSAPFIIYRGGDGRLDL